jgi:hypothetical protein
MTVTTPKNVCRVIRLLADGRAKDHSAVGFVPPVQAADSEQDQDYYHNDGSPSKVIEEIPNPSSTRTCARNWVMRGCGHATVLTVR